MILILFPTPLDAHCALRLDDTGQILIGTPATHASGRPGQGFAIPEGTPNGHGVSLTMSASGKVTLPLRGILWLGAPWAPAGFAAFQADDFHLAEGFVPLARLAVNGQFLGQV